jgi:hypothetical protein
MALTFISLFAPPNHLVSRAIQSNKDLETSLTKNNRAELISVGAQFSDLHTKLGTPAKITLLGFLCRLTCSKRRLPFTNMRNDLCY